MSIDATLLRRAFDRDIRERATSELKAGSRVLDRRERMVPDFLVVGAQKAGTSSLFAYLASHPGVSVPLQKEIRYFSREYRRGMAWYQRNFPLRTPGSGLTGEATPFYSVYPRALERIALDLPQAKIIMILREPVSRLISHYRHSVRLGDETLSLTYALERESDRLAPDLARLETDPFHPAYHLQRFSYLHRSLYASQVERVQHLFADRALFLRLDDFDTPEPLRVVTEFLGLPFQPEISWPVQNANPGSLAVGSDVPLAIVDRLRDDGARTADLLGWDRWVRSGT